MNYKQILKDLLEISNLEYKDITSIISNIGELKLFKTSKQIMKLSKGNGYEIKYNLIYTKNNIIKYSDTFIVNMAFDNNQDPLMELLEDEYIYNKLCKNCLIHLMLIK